MSIISDIQDHVFDHVILEIDGDAVTVLSGVDVGKIFKAQLEAASVDDGDFGARDGLDLREMAVARFSKSSFPSVKPNDLVRISGQIWRVTKVTNNPSDNSVDLDLIKVVAGKDS